MDILCLLPEAVCGEVLTCWLNLADIVRLDSSLSNRAKRPAAQALLYSPSTIYDTELLVDDLSFATANSFTAWLLARGVKVTGLCTSGVITLPVDWSRTEKYLIDRGAHITKLVLKEQSFCTVDVLQRFCELCPNVTDLTCPNSFNLPQYTIVAEAWPGLRKIITGSGLRDAGLLLLAQRLRQLQHVDIAAGTNLSEFAKARFILAASSTIRSLRFLPQANSQHAYLLYRAAVSANLPCLRGFDVQSVLTDEILLTIAQRCPLLDTLILQQRNNVTDAVLTMLPSYCQLRQICITSVNGCSGAGIVSLVQANRATLKKFRFDDSDCTTSLLNALAGCANLEELEITPYWDKAQITGWQALAKGCSKLTSLRALKCSMTDDDLCAVAQGCTRLRTLALSEGDESILTDRALQAVALHCSDLRCLELTRCNEVTDAGLCEVIAACTRLECLKLDILSTSTSLYALADHSKFLRTLHLHWFATATDGAIATLARRCTRLRDVRFDRVDGITAVGVGAIAAHCVFLRTVHVSFRDSLHRDRAAALARLFCSGVDVALS